MEKTLLEEFEMSKMLENKEININGTSPTILLQLINSEKIGFEETATLKKLNKNEDNSTDVANSILENLNIDKKNISALKFIFHELMINIYDHSKFKNAFVMGKSNGEYYDFSFIDDGIGIPQSLKDHNYEFNGDAEYILEAINGLSTKNDFGYIERGTGLNNTLNITINGSQGSALIVSGCAILYITQDNIIRKELEEKCIDGTLISLRMNLTEKIDIYKYLNQVKYEW